MAIVLFGESRVVEAALPMNQSHDEMRSHMRKALQVAHGTTDSSPWSESPYVTDMFPGHVVYSHKGQMMRRPYTSDTPAAGKDPVIKLGEPKPVHRAYVDTKSTEKEAQVSLITDEEVVSESGDVLVQESADMFTVVDVSTHSKPDQFITSPFVAKEGAGVQKVPVKLIGPGWGSMAYYSKEVLKRDGPKVFTKGTHMMWNHATDSQEAERPEGDLNNLAAVLTKDAVWKDSGPKGPGLYSEAKVFGDYAQQVAEKGAHIGISINAAIRGKEGEAEGRRGRIAESFVRAYSTDFVTKAGAGGAPVVPVQESQRGPVQEPVMEQDQKDKEDKAAREALATENSTLKAKLAVMEATETRNLAVATVAAVLKEAGIPYRQALLTRACEHPEMTDGKVSESWVKSVVADFSEGVSGTIEHFGEEPEPKVKEADAAATQKKMRESLKALGVPEAGLDAAVAGRA